MRERQASAYRPREADAPGPAGVSPEVGCTPRQSPCRAMLTYISTIAPLNRYLSVTLLRVMVSFALAMAVGAAAGLVSLVKACLCLQQRVLPGLRKAGNAT